MKNTTVESYLLSIEALGENIIKKIKISAYTDDVACYNVTYFDVELAKNRKKLITIKLSEYHLFINKLIRKQKLQKLSEY